MDEDSGEGVSCGEVFGIGEVGFVEVVWTIEAFPGPTKEVVKVPKLSINRYPRMRVNQGVVVWGRLGSDDRIEELPERNHELPYFSRTARTEAREPPLMPDNSSLLDAIISAVPEPVCSLMVVPESQARRSDGELERDIDGMIFAPV